MIEVFVAFALGAASTGAAFFFADRLAKRERAQLLDRVMARDYAAFKASEPRPEIPERKLTEEERKQAIEDARLLDEAHGLS